MRKLISPIIVIVFAVLLITVSCKKKDAINELTGVDKNGL